MEKEVIIITHTDADGFCSAAILMQKYPEAKIIHYNYEPYVGFIDRIPDGSLVFLVDTSFPNNVLSVCNKRFDFIWIDHHDTAIQEASKNEFCKSIKGIRRNGTSACELTWEYCYPDKDLPPAIKLIGRHDVWDKSYFPPALVFQYYLSSKNLWISKSTLEDWEYIINLSQKDIDELIDKYATVYAFVKTQNEITAKSICYEATILGLKCIVANRNRIGSDFFESVVKEEHDMMVSWVLNKRGQVKYTAFSNKESVHIGNVFKELTKGTNFKSGGHQGVGSLVCNKILFPNRDLTLEAYNPARI